MQEELAEIFEAIQRVAKRIKRAIDTKETGYSETQNSSGERQLQLDVRCDAIVEEELAKVSSIHTIASEEKQQPKTLNQEASIYVAYDPLDGSSLVDVNLSIGTIFGIYKGGFGASKMIAACYVLYGPRTELVFAKEAPKLYMLKGEDFVYVRDIKLEQKGKILAPGATQRYWMAYHKELIDSLFAQGYRLRYSGAMVADLHQILLKGGGLFSYPATEDRPKGKLRRLFEVFPFAYIFKKAGGKAVDGRSDLLTLGYDGVHDTTPCFFGSNYEIDQLLEVYAKHG